MQSEADRFKDLYDVEKHVMAIDGGILVEDPYPAFAELRAKARGAQGLGARAARLPARRAQPAARGAHLLRASPSRPTTPCSARTSCSRPTFYAGFTTVMFGKSILEMVGDEHRRYRALVQPAFSPKRAQWWIDRWITSLVDEAISAFEARGRAELNAELCARIPLQTITGELRAHPRGGVRVPRERVRRQGAAPTWTTGRRASNARPRCCGTSSRIAAPSRRTT